jgi:hypothetical protein
MLSVRFHLFGRGRLREITGENWTLYPKSTPVWLAIKKLDSVETFSATFFPTRDLIHGLPANVKSVNLECVDPTLLSDQELRTLVSFFESQKCKLDINFYVDEWPWELSAAGLRKWAAEIVFWTTADCAEVTFDMLDTERTRIRALEIVAEVEDSIAEYGIV